MRHLTHPRLCIFTQGIYPGWKSARPCTGEVWWHRNNLRVEDTAYVDFNMH